MQQQKRAASSFLFRTLGVLLAVSLLIVVWIGTHALADDARPALGQRHAAKSAKGPVLYYVLEPAAQVTASAETVALVASLGRPASDFNELRTALSAAGYRSIAIESRGVIDWRGGGFSRYGLQDLAGDIDAVLTDAGVARAHLIGHAFGNRVMRSFATLYPQKTAGLVLLAAGDKTDNMPPDVKEALTRSTLSFLPWSMREDSVRFAFFAAGNTIPDYWKTGWSAWGALGQARAAKAVDRQDFHAGGRGPMLVLQAQEDVIAPSKDAGEVLKAQYGERVTLVPIAHAGHALLPEQGARIAEATLAFLKAHPIEQLSAAAR